MPSPSRLFPIAIALAVLSLVSFIAGASMLGIGIAIDSAGGDGPEKPGWNDGHPVGLYLMTRYWMATGSLEKASYYFTSDGRVFVDPQRGFGDDALARHEGRHGTVRADGDQLIVTWSDGREQRGSLEKGEGGFNWDMGIFAPVEPFDDARELAGRWEGGASMSFGGGSAATSRTLELRDDGTFRGAVAASLQSTSDGSSVSAGSTGSHEGTWKLDGYSLVLDYSDGRTARGIAFPFDDESTPVYPDRFYFGGTLYRKL